MNPTDLLSEQELADMLGLKRATIARWRRMGKGPPAIERGTGPRRLIRYRLADVDAWLERGRDGDPQ